MCNNVLNGFVHINCLFIYTGESFYTDKLEPFYINKLEDQLIVKAVNSLLLFHIC